jgi:uncharacterized membrane protein
VADEARSAKPGKRSVSLRRLLVAGTLVWLPIIATVWVVSFFVTLMDRTLVLLPERYQPDALFGFHVPGLGVIFAFVVVLLTGLLVTNLIGRQLVGYWEELMQRIPLVRSIYGGVRSFTESVLSSSNSFRQVVAVEYPRPGIWSIGFVSTAPNPTSGFIILVPEELLIPLDMSIDAAMKMIVTCGVVLPEAPVAHLTPGP